jgi:hypothetical protein
LGSARGGFRGGNHLCARTYLDRRRLRQRLGSHSQPGLSRFRISGSGLTKRRRNSRSYAIVRGHLDLSYADAYGNQESQAEGIDKEATANRCSVLRSQGTPADAHCQAAHRPEVIGSGAPLTALP